MQAARTWSLLDPKPQLVYHAPTDVTLAWWAGIVMTRNQALAIAMMEYSIWPTPLQKQRIHDEYVRAYRAGAFGLRDWTSAIESGNALPYLQRCLEEPLKGLNERLTAAEVLLWFSPRRVRPSEHSQPVL